MLTDTRDQLTNCAQCVQGFITRRDLRTHLFTHTGEKPHKCTQCGKQFSHSYSLRRHMKTHTGDKPYSCPLCSKQFGCVSGLGRHIMTHSDISGISPVPVTSGYPAPWLEGNHVPRIPGFSPRSTSVCNTSLEVPIGRAPAHAPSTLSNLRDRNSQLEADINGQFSTYSWSLNSEKIPKLGNSVNQELNYPCPTLHGAPYPVTVPSAWPQTLHAGVHIPCIKSPAAGCTSFNSMHKKCKKKKTPKKHQRRPTNNIRPPDIQHYSASASETPPINLWSSDALDSDKSSSESSTGQRDDLEEEFLNFNNYVVAYEIVAGGSRKGNDLLVDSNGYSYTCKYEKKTSRRWVCAVRTKSNKCPATVTQRGDEMTRGVHNHNHQGQPGLLTKVKVEVEVKRKAATDAYRPASSIVQEVVTNMMDTGLPHGSQTNLGNLQRAANRFRNKMLPKEPTEMNFFLQEEGLPEAFLVADLARKGQRHIIFATTDQRSQLAKCETWYIDGTFKVISRPFVQLWTVHGFLESEDKNIKQVPLAFVLMTSREKEDYVKVLKTIQKSLPHVPKVKTVVTDFEAAVWGAVGKVFPEIQIQGCAFHWTQATWRKIQSMGLQGEYMSDDQTNKFLRLVLGLPFLSVTDIESVFPVLEDRALDYDIAMQNVLEYVNINWMSSTIWPPATWSVHEKSVRTNDDVEGWHRRLNGIASRSNLGFYRLIGAIHREAKCVTCQMTLVSEKELRRYQRQKYKDLQGRLHELWEERRSGKLDAMSLLEAVSYLNGPVM